MNKYAKYAISVEKYVGKCVGKMVEFGGKNCVLVDKKWGMLGKVVGKSGFAQSFLENLHDGFHLEFLHFTDKNGEISTFST